MFDGEDTFINDLKNGTGATADQAAVLSALFDDPDFQKLWNYLKACKKVTISLRCGEVTTDGVQRFGGYNPTSKTLTINPKFPAHQDNPEEEADTLIHELLHALFAVKGDCGDEGYPVAADLTDLPHDSKAANRKRSKDEHTGDDKKYMDSNYGDSASAPKTEYSDMNLAVHKFIAGIIKKLIKKTGKGKPTSSSKSVEKLTGSPP